MSIISVMEYTRSIIPASKVMVMVEVIGFAIRIMPNIIIIIEIMKIANHGESLMFRMFTASFILIRLFRINHIPSIIGIMIFSISG